MSGKASMFNRLHIRVLLALLVFLMVIAGVVGVVNTVNLRSLYEKTYTERLLLTNALMGSLVPKEDIEYYVELLKNQDSEFKERQVDFYHDREELFRLQEENASEEELERALDLLAEFHTETKALKDDNYWETLEIIRSLKESSHATYVYIMADTGLKSRDGETLYTYIFDAEDDGEYSSPDMDGLGTSDTGNDAFENVFLTKKQTELAALYQGDLGDLYFVCAPILDEEGEIIAVLGTDLALDEMNSAIGSSTFLFNSIIVAIFIVCGAIIFALLSRFIVKPISSLTKTARAFAEGNLHTPISESALRQNSEIGTLALALKSTLDATTHYLNSIPESLFIMNRECETYFRNEQFIKLFGTMQAEEFIQLLFSTNVEEELERMLSEEDSGATVWIKGSCFLVMFKEIVLTDMPENSIIVIANDITDLMREKENAQAAAAAKSDFLSRMSHEMRTPMNAIIGMSKVAEDSENIDNIRHCLATITASSEQLLGIINDVLDMSKIEAGKLALEYAPTDLNEVLHKASNLMRGAVENKKQSFEIVIPQDIQTYYHTDGLRLTQVLTNLLANAVKFTSEGGSVKLELRREGQQVDGRDLLQFSVSDTGIGITEEQLARLFNAFEQADGSIARKFGGTGLGLAISQSIVEKLGGHIEVDSKPGVGTTFFFTLSMESLTKLSDSEEQPEDGVPDFSQVRVLLVEDIELNKEIFLALMEPTQIITECAENGREALELFKEHPERFDLIIMDIQMPEMNGYEATEAIRNLDHPHAQTIPIIAMSANAFKEDVDRCLACGMNDHLAKPIDIKSVIEKIKHYTGNERFCEDVSS